MQTTISSSMIFKSLFLYLFTFSFSLSANAVGPDVWQKLQTGDAVVLMRHALAPGTGDPENFAVDDCSTQRNLSDDGRQQAARIGELLKANGITAADVFSSQWCRCIDTGNGLSLGKVGPLPLLNSFYQDRSTETEQTTALLQWLKNRLESNGSPNRKPALLVSHQVNITSLTNVYPGSGELVFLSIEGDELIVLGTLPTF